MSALRFGKNPVPIGAVVAGLRGTVLCRLSKHGRPWNLPFAEWVTPAEAERREGLRDAMLRSRPPVQETTDAAS